MLNVYFNFYNIKNKERKKEIVYCLNQLISNTEIDRIYLLNETDELFDDNKIQNIKIEYRPTYTDIFNLINNNDDNDVNVFLNSDCYFDEHSAILIKILIQPNEFYCLSRWDILNFDPFEIKYINYGLSHDAWCIKGKMKSNITHNYHQGIPGCDGSLTYIMNTHKYILKNPSLDIKIFHYHTSEIRTIPYIEWDKNKIDLPFFEVLPNKINKSEMQGQINITQKIGKQIFDIVMMNDVNNIVEIGTWNGNGSTQCVIKALKDSKKIHYSFISIESNKKMYDEAYCNNSDNLSDLKKFKILHGVIIDYTQLLDFDKLDDSNFIDYNKATKRIWFNEDIENIKNAPNILKKLPNKIDLLILDGGEFSTLAEFNLLKNKSKYIIADDTKCIKSSEIRNELKQNNQYEVIVDDINERNGFIVAKNLIA